MLLGGSQDPEDALRRAGEDRIRDWHRSIYTCDTRVMLFRGFGRPHRYLVLAEPTYMRLPTHFPDPELCLADPAEARSVLGVPECVDLEGRLVVRVGSLGDEFCVVCREIGIFTEGETGLVSRRFAPRVRLRGADLRGQRLRYEPLHGADLRGANLQGADLTHADFSRSDLRGAELRDTCLRHTSFHNARMNGVRLQGANLESAGFGDTDLQNADLEGARLHAVFLQNVRLTGARLAGADLRGAHFSRASLKGADLREANLAGATLEADLRGADLRGANLEGSNLREAQLGGADLREIRTNSHTGWPGDPPPDPSDSRKPTIEERNARLESFDGSALSWRWQMVSHGRHCLTARLPDGTCRLLAFSGSAYLHLPAAMTEAVIRTASPEQRDAFCREYPPDAPYRKPGDDYVVRCREGEFLFSAIGVYDPWIEAVDPADLSDLESYHRPLWPGGPALLEWWT